MKTRILFLVSLALAGCTAGPELQTYPRTQIDRPFTLPKGVATWETPFITLYEDEGTSTSFIPPIPVPLFWNSSLSDTWTLHWGPLPLSASHQLSHDTQQTFGLTFGLGAGYATNFGVALSSSFSLYHRWKFSPTVALETEPGVNGTFYAKNREPNWSGQLSIGPFFQLNPTFGVFARVRPTLIKGIRENLVVDTGSTSSFFTTDFYLTLPLSAGSRWSIGRQWDFDVQYTYYGIGQRAGYSLHAGILQFTHFW